MSDVVFQIPIPSQAVSHSSIKIKIFILRIVFRIGNAG